MRPGMEQRLERTLARGRAMAEARMTTTVEISAYSSWRYDRTLGREVRDLVSSFTTKARIRATSAQHVRETEVGDRSVVSTDREVHIPWDSPATEEGMEVYVVAISSSTDPTLLNSTLMLVGPMPGDQQTARRLLARTVLT